MSSPLVPVITLQGLAALANAQGTGVQATIDAIAVGRGVLAGTTFVGYTTTNTMVGLQGEQIRLPILSGQRRAPSGFTVLAVLPASSPGEYPINEVGFYLADGTLFALWSDPTFPLAFKSALADVELGFDLLFEAVPVSLLAITVLDPDVTDTAGVLAMLLAQAANHFTETLKINERLIARGI